MGAWGGSWLLPPPGCVAASLGLSFLICEMGVAVGLVGYTLMPSVLRPPEPSGLGPSPICPML